MPVKSQETTVKSQQAAGKSDACQSSRDAARQPRPPNMPRSWHESHDEVIVHAFMLTHILTSTYFSSDNRRRSAAAAIQPAIQGHCRQFAVILQAILQPPSDHHQDRSSRLHRWSGDADTNCTHFFEQIYRNLSFRVQNYYKSNYNSGFSRLSAQDCCRIDAATQRWQFLSAQIIR